MQTGQFIKLTVNKHLILLSNLLHKHRRCNVNRRVINFIRTIPPHAEEQSKSSVGTHNALGCEWLRQQTGAWGAGRTKKGVE